MLSSDMISRRDMSGHQVMFPRRRPKLMIERPSARPRGHNLQSAAPFPVFTAANPVLHATRAVP